MDKADRQHQRSPLAQQTVENIWVRTAAALNWRVDRGDAAYASTDGRGTMIIGRDEILDQQDAAAQLIFHELCHGLVEGPSAWSLPDWGLHNGDDRDTAREHACLRVQIHLADRYQLRELMAPTTEYRAYHDAVAGDPLIDPRDGAAVLAREAVLRGGTEMEYWLKVLDSALCETRETLNAQADVHRGVRDPAAVHPVGFAFSDGDGTCGTCAWLYRGGRGRPVERCRQSAVDEGDGRRTEARFRACVRWEPPVDCLQCGACCREAYHSVTVSVRDPVVWKQPGFITRTGHRFEVRREGERCAALDESTPPAEGATSSMRRAPIRGSFSCVIYDDRPRTCRDFEAGGRHCLVARRRVGVSP